MTRPSLIFAALIAALAAGCPSSAHAAGDWAWPVRGEVISPYRNGADPYAGGQHRGIDVAAPVGRAVTAPTGGRVTFTGTAGSSGLTVSLRTGDGRLDTSYLHLSAVSVREGQSVRRGERLGAVGTSGRRSASAPHLHFGVREAGSRHAYRDPLDFLAPVRGPGGDVPRALPAPLPGPAPARPGSAPAARRFAPAPSRRPIGVRSPAPGLAPAPALAPGRSAVARALRPAALGPAPAPGSARSAAPVTGRRAHAGSPAPAEGPATAPSRDPAAVPASPRAAARGEDGLDLGWVLACVGLAGAGLALARPAAMRAAAAKSRTAALRKLAPLLGGR